MLIHCDGFDHYATAQAVGGQKWDTVLNCTVGATYARFAGQGAQLGNSGAVLGKNVPTQSSYVVGAAYLWTQSNDSANKIFSFMDGATTQVSVHNANGIISAYRNGTVLLATATPRLAQNQYRYIEAKCFVNSTTGNITVRLDGVEIMNFTGNTQQSGSAQITQVRLGLNGNSCIAYVDDIYICDTTTPNSAGNNNSDFLGDLKVSTIYPNAAGAFTNYTRGGTNTGNDYSQVNEATPDEDTTYITDATIGDRDSFKFPAISLVGPVFGVMMWARARKDDASVRTLANVARSSAVDTVGASYNLSASYVYYGTVFELDPATSALWTPAGLGLAEFGVKTLA
jgi:hypothetical protein